MRRPRSYTWMLAIPFAVFILVLFLLASNNDPTNLTIQRAGDFVQLQSSTGIDVLVPLADVGDGAGLMSTSQAERLAMLPDFRASTVERSGAIRFTSSDWHPTGLTIPNSNWVLMSVSASRSGPFRMTLRDDLLALSATPGATTTGAVMRLNVDGQYKCSLRQATGSLSVACPVGTPDLVPRIAAVE